jgi:RNA polymerase sigma-70 factor, ECF subfamily
MKYAVAARPSTHRNQIAALYETLARQTGSPIVEMNRAIAIAEIHGPDAGLAILDTLELGHYRYFHSTHADLLRRAGRHNDARHAYQRALDLARTDFERRFLQTGSPNSNPATNHAAIAWVRAPTRQLRRSP